MCAIERGNFPPWKGRLGDFDVAAEVAAAETLRRRWWSGFRWGCLASTAFAAGLAIATCAQAQQYFGGYGVNSYVYGGGLPNTPFSGPYDQDIFLELRASSGNPLPGWDNVTWAMNDSDTVAVQGIAYGNGLNWPFIVLQGYDDNGNWATMVIEPGEWWPNDNQAHTMKMQLLQAGYGGTYRKDVNVTMDGRTLPARITTDPGSILHVALSSGGNFYVGYGSQLGISRFVAGAGVNPNPYSAPIFVVGDDLTLNYGWGYDLNYFPDVSFEIRFDDGCPGC